MEEPTINPGYKYIQGNLWGIMSDKVKIAAVQMDIKFKKNRSNLEKVLRYMRWSPKFGQLVKVGSCP